jgi:hypothetical protein
LIIASAKYNTEPAENKAVSVLVILPASSINEFGGMKMAEEKTNGAMKADI